MTSEAQRLAIAKAVDPVSFERHPFDCELIADGDGGWKPLPEYTSDLNAMHEAEKILKGPALEEYLHTLLRVIWLPEIKSIDWPEGGWWKITTHEMPKIVTATPAHRAEAFLRALGKWEGSEIPTQTVYSKWPMGIIK